SCKSRIKEETDQELLLFFNFDVFAPHLIQQRSALSFLAHGACVLLVSGSCCLWPGADPGSLGGVARVYGPGVPGGLVAGPSTRSGPPYVGVVPGGWAVFSLHPEERRLHFRGAADRILVRFCGPPEISRAEEHDKAAQARDILFRNRNASLELLEAQVEEVEQLRARLTREAAGSSTGAPGFMAPSAQEVKVMARGLRQANKSESHRRNWLLREVAAARLETLGWARKHRLLLDGLSSGMSYMVEELAGQVMAPRVAQGAGRLSRLMEAHHHHSFVKTGAWLEAFVDGLRTPPLLEEIVQVA
ncbi:hypothetical protein C0992_006775, partial [Termitomyces sp. T32_za158]